MGILRILNYIALVLHYIAAPHLYKIEELYVLHTTAETHMPIEI